MFTRPNPTQDRLGRRLVELRRELHRHPEVGLHLPRTQAAVLDALSGLPVEVTTGTACSSVTAVVRGRGTRGAVLLRGDLDALPVQEQTGLAFASEEDGGDARLRSRPAHRDAGRGRRAAVRSPRPARRRRGLDVPAR